LFWTIRPNLQQICASGIPHTCSSRDQAPVVNETSHGAASTPLVELVLCVRGSATHCLSLPPLLLGLSKGTAGGGSTACLGSDPIGASDSWCVSPLEGWPPGVFHVHAPALFPVDDFV
jgi:hypothetical protein